MEKKKMKKVIALLFVFLLAMGAAACSSEPKQNVKLADVYDDIAAEVTLPEMIDINENTLYEQYGIQTEDVAQGVYKQLKDFGAGKVDEIIMVEAKDADKAAAIKTLLDARLQDLISQSANYDAAAVDVLNKSSVQQDGNFVALFISKDASLIKGIYEKNIK